VRVWIGLVALVAVAGTAFAASNDALQRALVGRHVMIPFDMPVSYLGVDFDGDEDLRRDDGKRIERIGMWGTSILGGEIATITEVRVSRRKIEILLGKGGLSTTRLLREHNPDFRIGGDMASRSDPDAHSSRLDPRGESEREEREAVGSGAIVHPPTPDERALYVRTARSIGDTLGAAAAARRVEGSRLFRTGVGSRLRILFDEDVPAEWLDPRNLMLALSEHIRFVREDADVAVPSATSDSTGVVSD